MFVDKGGVVATASSSQAEFALGISVNKLLALCSVIVSVREWEPSAPVMLSHADCRVWSGIFGEEDDVLRDASE